MKLKLDENGNVVVDNGKPVYVDDSGKEIAYDVPAMASKITSLNSEAKTHREAKEAAEAALKQFEGIEDAAAARKAMETVKNLDDKKLVDAGEVERVKAEAIKAIKDQYKPVEEERDSLRESLRKEKIGGSFNRSKYVQEKLGIPADLVEARFGSNFKMEGDKVVGYDQSGNQLYSPANPGELASFDEAMQILVENYPYKDSILKGSAASGGGMGGQNNSHGSNTIPRARFDEMNPAEKSQAIKDGAKIVD